MHQATFVCPILLMHDELVQASSFTNATFGGGCFWGPDVLFARVPGVLHTEVGYSQGTVEAPTYEDVCSGLTGHNEVVKVSKSISKVLLVDSMTIVGLYRYKSKD